ncbi:MAG TPA: hypothetical protein VG122_08365 [Gemmata sp.]|jgi:hypothetical protein|nr:hypothetical protein [Gemmata sp.]
MRFRNWVIVLVIVICGIGRATADENEDRAVAAVEKLGGQVLWDEMKPSKPVMSVDLRFSQVTDVGLKEITPLKTLTTLNLTGTINLTDVGIKEIAQLKNLTKLDLTGTKVTDAGLKELAQLKTLTTLNLIKTEVTDAGLKELAQLKALTELTLLGTKVTAAGVAELQKALPQCKIER